MKLFQEDSQEGPLHRLPDKTASPPLPGPPPTGKSVIDESSSDDSERSKFGFTHSFGVRYLRTQMRELKTAIQASPQLSTKLRRILTLWKYPKKDATVATLSVC